MTTSPATFATYQKQQGTSLAEFERSQIESDAFTLPTSAANGVWVDKSRCSAMAIRVSGACTLTFFGCTKKAMQDANNAPTLVACIDKTGTAMSITVASAGIVECPPGLFAMPIVAPISDTGSITATIILAK